jgi:apolipoprotein N-acyltransferase
VWGAVFALLLALSFPFRVGELRFDVGILVGWLALAPLALMLKGLPPRRAFLWTTGFATLGFSAILFWLFVVVVVHGHAPAIVGVAAVLGVSLVLAAHAGLAAALTSWLTPAAGRSALFVLPAAWVAAEHLLSFDLFGGFPWAYLGYAAHRDGPILELAALGGVWGLSFLLALIGTMLSRGLWRAAIIVLAVAHGVGFAQRLLETPKPGPGDGPLRVQIVQGSIPQGQKWDPDLAMRNFDVHIDLSRLAVEGDVDLILWPESAVPILLEQQLDAREAVQQLARDTGATVVLGGVGFEWPDVGDRPRYFNSAFVISPAGNMIDRYDKTHLVPFGEYVPMRRVLGFLSGVATGLVQGDLAPGERPRVLRMSEDPGAGHAASALICYEVIYPGLVRQAVRDGARILLNLTNDAWYGRTSAPHQFLAIAATRSAEHGLPMLRAANTGVSGVIDAGGKVLHETPIFERRALATLVPRARTGPTVYTRLGDWVVAACWGLLIAIGGIRVVKRREFKDQRDTGRASGSRRTRR